MDLYLKEKIIVVTGGSKGIGYGICQQLIKEGAEFDNYVFEEEEIEEMKPYLESI